jgi:hypothetical protein
MHINDLEILLSNYTEFYLEFPAKYLNNHCTSFFPKKDRFELIFNSIPGGVGCFIYKDKTTGIRNHARTNAIYRKFAMSNRQSFFYLLTLYMELVDPKEVLGFVLTASIERIAEIEKHLHRDYLLAEIEEINSGERMASLVESYLKM